MTQSLESVENAFLAAQMAYIHGVKSVLLAKTRDALFGETAAELEGPSVAKAPRQSWQTRTERKKYQRRAPSDLEALTVALRAYVAKHPGLGIEAISKGLGVPTKDLVLPTKKLIASGAVRYKGERRARRYFPKGAR